MAWTRAFGLTEIILIGTFSLFYMVYIIRMIRISRSLNTPYSNVFLKLTLRTGYFALLIIALMGPSFGNNKKEVVSVGKDIMICVDLSQSMNAFDIQPSRLEKVKYEMKKIVEAFQSDRIGVVIFSSEAFMQCPLTFDQNALNLFIETMNSTLVPSKGTDFGPPLRMALDKLKDPDSSPSTQQKSKIIVLISDGEDFGDEASSMVDEIEDEGIKLFTLGVGTADGSQIYSGRGYQTDKQGNTVISKLNTEKLRTLAGQTGGQYFEITETKNDVPRLINAVSQIEGELRDARLVDVSANRYYYFLLGAVILIALDALTHIKSIVI